MSAPTTSAPANAGPTTAAATDRGLRAAALLGVAGGLRTTAPLAGLVAGGRLVGGAGGAAVLAATAAELGADKHPETPDRIGPQGVLPRLGSSAVAGVTVAGSAGALAAATTAGLVTFVAHRVRREIVRRTAVPDLAVAVAEDALALGTAVTVATRLAPSPAVAAAEPGKPGGPDEDEAQAALGTAPTPAPDRPRPADAVLRGVVAGAAGTAAMSAAQTALIRFAGAPESDAPAKVGERILGLAGKRVRRRDRDALNQGMHWLYGTGWGIPLGLAAGSRSAPGSALTQGAGFGLLVWGAELVQLPVLGLGVPVWRMQPGDLARDAGLHALYGFAAAGALRVLRRG